MPQTDSNSEYAELLMIQSRARLLVRNQPHVRAALIHGFSEFGVLRQKWHEKSNQNAEQKALLVRRQLERGRVVEPRLKNHLKCFFSHVTGLCPAPLHAQIFGKYELVPLPDGLEQKSAAAALKALNRQELYNSALPHHKKRAMAAEFRRLVRSKKFVPHVWMVIVEQPASLEDPPHPHSLSREDLARWSAEDLLTLARYHIGGLIDFGMVAPLVPKPKDSADAIDSLMLYLDWRQRFPVVGNPEKCDDFTPDPACLPVDIARQFLDLVEQAAVSLDRAAVSSSPAAKALADAAALLDQAATAIEVAYPEIRGNRRYDTLNGNGLPIDDGSVEMIWDVIAQFDKAIKALDLVGPSGLKLPESQVGLWHTWSYWVAPAEVGRVANLLLPLAIRVHVWYVQERQHHEDANSCIRRHLPIDAPQWAVDAAHQTRLVHAALTGQPAPSRPHRYDPPPSSKLVELNKSEQKVWDELKGACLSPCAISSRTGLSEDLARRCVFQIRQKKGRDSIATTAAGYTRPDAPPSDDECTADRRRPSVSPTRR